MRKQQILGSAIVLGTILVLALIVAGVSEHPASIHGSGAGLLWTDVLLLILYGLAGLLEWKQTSSSTIAAAMVGAQVGLIVGGVGIANHLIEAFVPARPFVLIISPVLLTLALLGMAGAAAWERGGSLPLAVIGGVCCAIVATLITLAFATSFNLLFAARVDRQLRDAFAGSGMVDRAGFRVRNILEASSEILARMPILALCLAFVGAVIQMWLSRESRRFFLVAAIIVTPILFVIGVAILWHANALERAARPPFVMSGVVLSGISLCAACPIWSASRRLTAGPGRAARS